jgi:hypothetical protein
MPATRRPVITHRMSRERRSEDEGCGERDQHVRGRNHTVGPKVHDPYCQKVDRDRDGNGSPGAGFGQVGVTGYAVDVNGKARTDGSGRREDEQVSVHPQERAPGLPQEDVPQASRNTATTLRKP